MLQQYRIFLHQHKSIKIKARLDEVNKKLPEDEKLFLKSENIGIFESFCVDLVIEILLQLLNWWSK